MILSYRPTWALTKTDRNKEKMWLHISFQETCKKYIIQTVELKMVMKT